MYPGLHAARNVVRSSASPSARRRVTLGAWETRNADETTSSESAIVTASWDADADAWNSATGTSPTAQKAHRDRVARWIASQASATYAASAARRDASTIT